MKKEIVATIILIFTIVAGFFNMHYARKTTDNLIAQIGTAEEQLFSGDIVSAEQTVQQSLKEWLSKDQYTHIMLRHDDVDNVTEAYYELLSGMQTEYYSRALFSSLTERLDRLAEIEVPGLSSIF